MQNEIRVILVEPGKVARVAYIDSSLEGMQAIVGGLIEPFYPFEEEVCIVCNDEGKLLGIPLNRTLRDPETNDIFEIIAGTFFVCNCSDESFGNLDDAQVEYYLKMFNLPEAFGIVNGKLMSICYNPETEI